MELKRSNFELSPQGLLDKMEDDKRRLVVPHGLQERIL